MNNETGFTLTELLIAMAIGAILATIAYPSYQEHVRKSYRSEAQSLLMDIASRQEKFFTENNRYAVNLSTLNFSSNTVSSDTGRYTASITASTNTTFTAQAAPSSKGGQNQDSCATFSLNELGVHSVSGTDNRCW